MAIDGLSSITRPIDRSGLVCVASTSFTTAATVSVDNCFTSSYDNFVVQVRSTGTIASVTRLRFRSSSADNSTANYNAQRLGNNGATSTAGRVTAQTSVEVGAATSDPTEYQFVVSGPQLAEKTAGHSFIAYATGTAPELTFTSFNFNLTTQFDGFSLIPDSGTISGVVRVYGLRNTV